MWLSRGLLLSVGRTHIHHLKQCTCMPRAACWRRARTYNACRPENGPRSGPSPRGCGASNHVVRSVLRRRDRVGGSRWQIHQRVRLDHPAARRGRSGAMIWGAVVEPWHYVAHRGTCIRAGVIPRPLAHVHESVRCGGAPLVARSRKGEHRTYKSWVESKGLASRSGQSPAVTSPSWRGGAPRCARCGRRPRRARRHQRPARAARSPCR